MNDVKKKISDRAYALYVERGSKPGHAMEDWITAEKEITGRTNAKEPQSPAQQKPQRIETRKSNKPYDATLFSSTKNNVRSTMK
jgi:hypothetical protein